MFHDAGPGEVGQSGAPTPHLPMSETSPRRPENLYAQYHAHVYFGPETVAQARQLAERAGQELFVTVGRVHERPVGPHPHWSFQIAFDAAEFDRVIAWLEAERDGLDVLVHGLTGDDYVD